MVPCPTSLPEGYRESFQIDLQKNKKLALLVNGIAILIAAVMAIPALCLVPISGLFSFEQGFMMYILRFIALILGSIGYILLHELTHGIFMKRFSGQKPKYGFTGLYAYAGSTAYFSKIPYLIIALAPVVILGVILLVLNLLVPTEWFYVVYFIQMTNLSGAAGDLYVTARFSKLPKDILVQDTGVSMTVYEKA